MTKLKEAWKGWKFRDESFVFGGRVELAIDCCSHGHFVAVLKIQTRRNARKRKRRKRKNRLRRRMLRSIL